MPQGLSLNLDTNDVEEIIEDYLYNISKGYETEDSEESAIDLYDLYEDQLSEYGEDDEDGVTPTEDNTILHRMVVSHPYPWHMPDKVIMCTGCD